MRPGQTPCAASGLALGADRSAAWAHIGALSGRTGTGPSTVLRLLARAGLLPATRASRLPLMVRCVHNYYLDEVLIAVGGKGVSRGFVDRKGASF